MKVLLWIISFILRLGGSITSITALIGLLFVGFRRSRDYRVAWMYFILGIVVFIGGRFLARYKPESISKLTGELSWTGPQWWNGIKAWMKNKREKMLERIKDSKGPKKKKIIQIVLPIIAVVMLIVVWSMRRTTRDTIDVSLITPSVTKLRKDISPYPLRLIFSRSAAKMGQIKREVNEGVEIDPKIEGSWRWQSDKRLIFLPTEDWAVGQKYTVTFKSPRDFFPKHVHLKNYKYKFMTVSFSARIKKAQFYTDPMNPKEKRVVATVKFSHAVDAGSFKRHVSLRMRREKKSILGGKGKDIPFVVDYDEFKGEAYIKSDLIGIPLEEQEVNVIIEKGIRAERGGPAFQNEMVKTVRIPGMYDYFRVDSVNARIIRNEHYEMEQVLIVELSTGMLESEMQDNISVYMLPKDRPPVPGDERTLLNHRWRNVEKIDTKILDKSEKVDLLPIPTDKEFAKTHSFKFEAVSNRDLYVKINKGINSYEGYVLAKEYERITRVPVFKRELKIMHEGAILSLSGDNKISVISNGVEAIRATFARVLPGQINHLVSQTGGNFINPYFRNYNFNQDNITEVYTRVYMLAKTKRPETQYAAVDFSDYVAPNSSKNGLFFLKVESWDPINKRTTGMADKRLILVTDLGLVVKEEKTGSRKVFVQSIPGGRPVSSVRVKVIGKNGIQIASRTTGENGVVSFPSLSSFHNEKKPTAIIASKGGDTSFIPYEWQDRKLEYSRFDIGGIRTSISPGKLKAYLFSDRGIYRPGDEIHVGYIVKREDWKQKLVGIPLETVVVDARGLEVQKKRIRLSSIGFKEMRYRTEENALTGSYQFRVYIVKDDYRRGLIGSVSVRVEEFLPDRMKITTRFSEDGYDGWVSPTGLKGQVSLVNLFGAPAENRRIGASITASPRHPYFKKFREYTFLDLNRRRKNPYSTFTERLDDMQTNEDGEVEYSFNLDRFVKAFYRLSFFAEGYEASGGRAVGSESSIYVSDLPYLLGYKSNGDLRYIKRNTSRSIDIIAINQGLKKINAEGLNIHLIERRYVSSLVKQRDGTYMYKSVEKEVFISSSTVTIPEKGYTFNVPSETPGNYLLSVRDNENTELLRVEYNIIGQANLSRSLEKNAELQVKLNKTDYEAGETIEMQITAPYTGAGVITIERDKVYAHKWFKTRATNSVQYIKVPNNIEGNGYVNVTFVRSMDSKEVFMSPLSYCAMPFTVSLKRRSDDIELDIPDEAKPGEPYKIRYKGNRAGKVVVFAVDEGILQVAKYKTPDPLAEFFKKRALEVKTSQIMDLILPEIRILKELFSISGDGFDRDALSKNLNPFKRKRHKPVVFWSGIVSIGTNWREVTFDIPDYFNGTVRVMAVSVANDTIGVASKKGLVRGPFVLTPNVPTFVAPKDTFEVTTGIFNNMKDSGKEAEVLVKLKTSKHLMIEGAKEFTLKIPESREKVAKFNIKANNILGSGNLTFTASMGGKESKYSIDLSVRPPVTYITTLSGGFLKKRAKTELDIKRKMYPHFRVLDCAASILPVGIAHGLNIYLEKYPYYCTEQLVSKTVPAVVLKKHPEFGYNPKQANEKFERTLGILRSRQNSEGAFGFWAANSHVSAAQSIYTLHFLTDAQDTGFYVPPAVFNRGKNYLRKIAVQNVSSLREARESVYAIYVLTRHQEVTTSYTRKVEESLTKSNIRGWKKDVCGIYLAAVYKMHRMNSEANRLISGSKLGDPQKVDYNYFYDNLYRDAVLLYVMAKHFPERLPDIKAEQLLHIVEPVSRGFINTTNAAHVIMALGAYVDAVGYPNAQEVKITQVLDDDSRQSLKLPDGMFPKVQYVNRAVKLLIENLNDQPLFYQNTQAGFDFNLPEKEIKNNLEIYREYRSNGRSKTNKAKLGNQIEVCIRIRSLDKQIHNNIAVVDLLPGGFEVVNNPGPSINRNARIAVEGTTWNVEYADVREDRVVLFGSVGPDVQQFVYKIRATNKGNYIIPPPYGESMYDKSINMRGLAGKFEIKD